MVFAVTIVAFLPSLRNGWVNWDDDIQLLANPYWRGLGIDHLKWMFTTALGGCYMPLTWISFAADYTLWGLQPAGFHLTNLILHGLSAVMFYFVSLQLLKFAEPKWRERALDDPRIWAAVSALLFAVHPLRIESVAWAIERKDTLAGFFYFPALLFYLKVCQERADRGRWLIYSLAAYTCSLLAKPLAISFPITLMILDIYPMHRLTASPRKWLVPSHRSVLMEKVPFWALSLSFGVIGIFSQAVTQNLRDLRAYGWDQRLAGAFYGLAFHIWKTVLPIQLSALYPASPQICFPNILVIASVLFVVTVSAAFLILRKRWPAGLAAWIYYVAALAPMLGLVKIGNQIAADHYTYLPMLSWSLLAAGFLWTRQRNPILWPCATAVVLLLCAMTWSQAQVWHDSVSLWSQAISVDPENFIAHHDLGLAYAEQGELGPAAEQFQEAIRIDPKAADDWNNLGLTLAGRGLEDESEQDYQEALSISPDHPYANNNLGLVLLHRGSFQDAAEHFQTAVMAKPDFAEAHNNWGIALADLHKTNAALAQFKEALRLNPEYSQARLNLEAVSGRKEP